MSAKTKRATKKRAAETAAKKPKRKATKRQATRRKATTRRTAMLKSTSAKAAPKKSSKVPTTLGGLTADERQHLAELIDQGRAPVVADSTGKLSVVFYVQDGHDKSGKRKPAFTVAMVAVGGELKGVGVAKLNPKDDEWDNERGRLIALARAVRAEARLQ